MNPFHPPNGNRPMSQGQQPAQYRPQNAVQEQLNQMLHNREIEARQMQERAVFNHRAHQRGLNTNPAGGSPWAAQGYARASAIATPINRENTSLPIVSPTPMHPSLRAATAAFRTSPSRTDSRQSLPTTTYNSPHSSFERDPALNMMQAPRGHQNNGANRTRSTSSSAQNNYPANRGRRASGSVALSANNNIDMDVLEQIIRGPASQTNPFDYPVAPVPSSSTPTSQRINHVTAQNSSNHLESRLQRNPANLAHPSPNMASPNHNRPMAGRESASNSPNIPTLPPSTPRMSNPNHHQQSASTPIQGQPTSASRALSMAEQQAYREYMQQMMANGQVVPQTPQRGYAGVAAQSPHAGNSRVAQGYPSPHQIGQMYRGHHQASPTIANGRVAAQPQSSPPVPNARTYSPSLVNSQLNGVNPRVAHPNAVYAAQLPNNGQVNRGQYQQQQVANNGQIYRQPTPAHQVVNNGYAAQGYARAPTPSFIPPPPQSPMQARQHPMQQPLPSPQRQPLQSPVQLQRSRAQTTAGAQQQQQPGSSTQTPIDLDQAAATTRSVVNANNNGQTASTRPRGNSQAPPQQPVFANNPNTTATNAAGSPPTKSRKRASSGLNEMSEAKRQKAAEPASVAPKSRKRAQPDGDEAQGTKRQRTVGEPQTSSNAVAPSYPPNGIAERQLEAMGILRREREPLPRYTPAPRAVQVDVQNAVDQGTPGPKSWDEIITDWPGPEVSAGDLYDLLRVLVANIYIEYPRVMDLTLLKPNTQIFKCAPGELTIEKVMTAGRQVQDVRFNRVANHYIIEVFLPALDSSARDLQAYCRAMSELVSERQIHKAAGAWCLRMALELAMYKKFDVSFILNTVDDGGSFKDCRKLKHTLRESTPQQSGQNAEITPVNNTMQTLSPSSSSSVPETRVQTSTENATAPEDPRERIERERLTLAVQQGVRSSERQLFQKHVKETQAYLQENSRFPFATLEKWVKNKMGEGARLLNRDMKFHTPLDNLRLMKSCELSDKLKPVDELQGPASWKPKMPIED